jgi:hypothetical protein
MATAAIVEVSPARPMTGHETQLMINSFSSSSGLTPFPTGVLEFSYINDMMRTFVMIAKPPFEGSRNTQRR